MRKFSIALTILIATTALAEPGNAALFKDSIYLDEMVVVGFAQHHKVDLTGAISQIDMDEVLGNRPITNVGAALQGVIPGLTISGVSKPGQPKEYNIRGVVSINGASPLILIDNVEGDINTLNPQDIESVTVLKDAASAAIYGARAAGGVILITTKHPKRQQKAEITYSFNMGFERSIGNPQQASLNDYIKAYKEAGFSSQYWAGNGKIDRWQELLKQYREGGLQGVYDNGIFRDSDGAVYYLKERDVLGSALETGIFSNHNISVSGATDRIRYRISGNYSHEDGPLVSDKDVLARKSLNAFISADVSKWFTQEANVFYTDRKSRELLFSFRDPYSMKAISWYPEGYMPKEIIGTENDILIDSPRNACLYQPASKTSTSTPRILLRSVITPLKGWTITGEYTFQRQEYRYDAYVAGITVADPQLAVRLLPPAGQDTYTRNTSTTKYNALNIFSNYAIALGSHNIGITAGFNQESNTYDFENAKVMGQTVSSVPSLQGATGTKEIVNGLREYSVRGVFGRLTYSFLGKYLAEFNCRYDGSSKFPKDNRFGFFPSVSAGWRISEESFMTWSRTWLDNLKIRASWGSIGNQNIAPYGYIAGMSVNESTVWIDGGNKVNTITTPGLIRHNYTWENVSTLNIGMDMTLLANRLTLTFDWYNRTTTGMLGDGVELPGVVGTTAPMQNVSDMKTRGWELSLNWHDRIGELTYRIGMNLYDHKSEITKYNNKSGNLSYYYNGQQLGEIWGYKADGFYTIDDFDIEKAKTGVWQLRDGVPALDGYTAKPGDIKFRDLDGNGKINAGAKTLDDPGDLIVIGNNTPRWEYGATLGMTWKGLDLSVMLQGIGKRDYVLPTETLFTFGNRTKSDIPFSSVYSNQTAYWTAKSYDPESPEYMVAANPGASLPRIYGQVENAESNRRASDRFLQSASYLRIKNITLGYSLPKSILNTTKVLSAVQFFVTCENMATFSSLPKGIDPELLTWGYPFYRTWAFGVNVTF